MNFMSTLLFVAAILGCSTDGPEAIREGWRIVRVGHRLSRKVLAQMQTTLRNRQPKVSPCPAEQERREHLRREFLALDPFKNSTEHEEYRPS